MADHVHSFEQIIVEPTCRQTGHTLLRCACGYEHKTDFKPITNHLFVPVASEKATCTAPGSLSSRCSHCGQENTAALPPLGHAWGDWNAEKFATCTESGSRYRYCGRCGTRDTEEVPAIGHRFNRANVTKQNGRDVCFCENCGEVVPYEKKPGKLATYIRSHKKLVISLSIVLVLAIALAILLPTWLIPQWHYSQAKKLIKSGDYKEAYEHLYACIDYKDSRELREDFRVAYGYEEREYIRYEDGEVAKKSEDVYEKTYNEYGDLTKVIEKDRIDNKTTEYEDSLEYDSNGNMLKSTSYMDGEKIGFSEFTYDQNGNQTEEIYYDADGKADGRYEYTYDQNGNQTEEIFYNADGKAEWRSESTYDQNGNQTEYISYYADGKVDSHYESTYDQNGNQTEEISYDADGKIRWRYEYTYDQNGNQTECISYNADGKVDGRSEFTYDENGNQTELISYDADGKVDGRYESTYDENGNQTELISYDADGKICWRYEYTYDENGYKTSYTWWEYYNDGEISDRQHATYSDYYVFYEPQED